VFGGSLDAALARGFPVVIFSHIVLGFIDMNRNPSAPLPAFDQILTL
jgi:hypothetical protein